ncbi:MAG: carbohydrate-binding family 9-like protein [Candidatus Syntrophosphaera sp.]
MRHKLMFFLPLLLCGMLMAETFPVPGLDSSPPSYTCFRPVMYISVDGNLDEPDWLQTPWTRPFTGIEGDPQPEPRMNTYVKMLWDARGLYVAARMEDPHVWGSVEGNDADLSPDSFLSVYIDPNGDTHEYFRLDVNALGTVADRFIIQPPREGSTILRGWDFRGWNYAVAVEGTQNNALDTDLEWTVEMLIPWNSMSAFAGTPCPPKEGDIWRVNFLRSQREYEITDGQYQAITDKPPKQWVWSPQGSVGMDYPERWGYVLFTTKRVGVFHPAFELSEEQGARQYLSRVYYAQKQHWLDKGAYAGEISELGLEPFPRGKKSITPKIETTSRSFIAILELDSPDVLMVSEDGRVTKLEKQ